MKITVVGIGYVGLANAILLAQHNHVTCFDIDEKKIQLINKKKTCLEDQLINEYLKNVDLNLRGTSDKLEAYNDADYIIIATPTDYDDKINGFNTGTIESVILDVKEINPRATIIIKSTVPIGYTERIKKQFDFDRIIFSPEFLREGKALYDNLNPSRIIIGDESTAARKFIDILTKGIAKKNVPVLYTNNSEAEAIKLFSNTYLAMRVAYFNELDNYALINNLRAKKIIDGMCLDPRIGQKYNNPSFGYGGYCLPKDTKQLLVNYEKVPQRIVQAIVDSNEERKNFIVQQILNMKPKVVGVYRLIMKAGSDNTRESATTDIIKKLSKQGVETIIYEPMLKILDINGAKLINSFEDFEKAADVILTNRLDDNIKGTGKKIYTRDIFGEN